MKKIAILFLGFALVFASCSNRKVSRIDPSETPDISGSWNNT